MRVLSQGLSPGDSMEKKKLGVIVASGVREKGFSKPNAVWYTLTHHSKSGRNLPVVVQVFGAAETL
jgi:hypothetical protein